MSRTEEILETVHATAAPACGGLAIALTLRRFREADVRIWIKRLRLAADKLEELL